MTSPTDCVIGLQQLGHRVTVIEQSRQLIEVGAGIQIPPNAARVLDSLGIFDRIKEKAVVLNSIGVRRWANYEELTSIDIMPQILDRYGWPLSFIHRGDLQRILLGRVEELGIEMRLGQRVVEVGENFAPSIQLASGEWLLGDVIIAADGIKSRIRALMASKTGITDRSTPTGDAAFRLLIPRENLLPHPEALQLLDGNQMSRIIGPGGHIIIYPIRPLLSPTTGKHENQILNVAILHPKTDATPDTESWTSTTPKSSMFSFCAGWAPIVQTLLSLVPGDEILDWTLNSHSPLPTWLAGSSIALIGDACHPMLPYLAQGAAQCLEDAAVLIECFRRTVDVPLALKMYELARKERAEKLQASGSETRNVIHLPDGPEQRARDEKYRMVKGHGEKPDRLVDTGFQDYMYGVDVVKEIGEKWEELVKLVEEERSGQ